MLAFEKKETYYLQGNKEIYAITILEVGFKKVIGKVQYNDGMVCEREFNTDYLTDLITEY